MKIMKQLLLLALTVVLLSAAGFPARADDTQATINTMEAYFEFVDYGGATIFPEQIPKEEWKKFFVIDARDQAQFDKDHIPGASNIEWRQVLAKRGNIPKEKPVLIYCNSGTLSAQAGFALRVAGYENVRILQGGFSEWKLKGGMDAAEKATATPKH